MNWSDYEGEDACDAEYGELGPAIQAFESWIAQNTDNGAYSILEAAYDSDAESLAERYEEGEQHCDANYFMERVADNMDVVYGMALPTWQTIKQEVAAIIDPAGVYGWSWDTLIEEAEEFFYNCWHYEFTDHGMYE